MALVSITRILCKVHAVWLLNLCCIYTILQNSKGVSVVVYTDLSGKELHRQVVMGRVVTSESLGGVMVSTLARYTRDAGLILTLGAMLPIFITTHNYRICLWPGGSCEVRVEIRSHDHLNITACTTAS